MMRQIIATSLRFRYIVIAAAAGLMLFGSSHIQSMPVDVFPEFAPPKVEVQTITLGLSASEVESLVTIPLEQALSGIEDLKVLRSKSVAQLSQIIMLFQPGTEWNYGVSTDVLGRVIEVAALEVANRRATGRTVHLRLDPEREIDVSAKIRDFQVSCHGRKVPFFT